jgi:hypothetical protein
VASGLPVLESIILFGEKISDRLSKTINKGISSAKVPVFMQW